MTSSKKVVLVADKLAREGLEVLERAPGIEVRVQTGLKGGDLIAAMKGVHAVLVRSATQITAEVLAAADSLVVVGRAGVGVDNVDVASATKRGVLVMNTPGGSAVTTGEHALSLLFSLARQIPQATAALKQGKWEKSRFMGREISGKTLGIIGVGNIGRVVAERARGLKMKVIAFDPFLSTEAATPLGIEVRTLDDVLSLSDFISIHAPLTADTRHLLGKTAFAKMKKSAFVVNAARGGIIDEAALYDALKSGQIAGAALDVFEKEPCGNSPLLELENFICTPHLGASTDEAQVAVSVAIAEQTIEYLLQGTLRNAVNFPAISREQLEVLGPYLHLAEKMGSAIAQLHKGTVHEVHIQYDGEIAGYDVSALTSAALAGLFSRSFSEGAVNHVNAKMLAQARGVKVLETKSAAALDYTSQITLRATSGPALRGPDDPPALGRASQDQGSEDIVAGTLFGKRDARIVRINGFRLEVYPEGTAIVVHNSDRPGVVGAIGTLLGRAGINVARMQLGLDRDNGEALSVWSVEPAPSEALCEELARLPHTLSVQSLSLG